MLKFCVLCLILIVAAAFSTGCKPVRVKRPSGQKVQRVAEDTFVKTDGWELPPLSEMTAGGSGTSHQRNADGQLIPITFTNYLPAGELISSEPLDSVGYKLGDLKILSIIKCEIKGRPFEISVQ